MMGERLVAKGGYGGGGGAKLEARGFKVDRKACYKEGKTAGPDSAAMQREGTGGLEGYDLLLQLYISLKMSHCGTNEEKRVECQ